MVNIERRWNQTSYFLVRGGGGVCGGEGIDPLLRTVVLNIYSTPHERGGKKEKCQEEVGITTLRVSPNQTGGFEKEERGGVSINRLFLRKSRLGRILGSYRG